MLENEIGEFVHTCGRSGAGRTHDFVTHGINGAYIVNKAASEIDLRRQTLTTLDQLLHFLVGRIAAGQHFA